MLPNCSLCVYLLVLATELGGLAHSHFFAHEPAIWAGLGERGLSCSTHGSVAGAAFQSWRSPSSGSGSWQWMWLTVPLHLGPPTPTPTDTHQQFRSLHSMALKVSVPKRQEWKLLVS